MANRAAMVAMALFAAVLIAGEAEAGRLHRHRRHHDSPPAPPGFNEPMAAPSPYFRGDFSGSPAGGPEAPGPEGSHPRRLSESASFADSPFTFGEGPTPAAAAPEGFNPQAPLSGSQFLAASPFADSPIAFGEGPAPESGI